MKGEGSRQRARALSVALIVTLALPWRVAWAGPPAEGADAAAAGDAPDAEPGLEPQTALDWYEVGIAEAQAKNYVASAEAFLRSYELQPTSAALFNAAYAYESAGEAVLAVRTYARFVSEPGASPEQVRKAEASLEVLATQVVVLKGVRYAVDRPPAQLLINGVEYGLDDFPVVVEPGDITVEVRDAEGEGGQERYVLYAGEEEVLDVRNLLRPSVETPPAPTIVDRSAELETLERLAAREERAQSERVHSMRLATYTSLGFTAGAGVATLTMGLLADRERRAYLADICDGACPEGKEVGDPQTHYERYNIYQPVFISAAAVTVGLTIATGVLALVTANRKAKLTRLRELHRQQREALTRERATLELRLAPGGLQLRF